MAMLDSEAEALIATAAEKPTKASTSKKVESVESQELTEETLGEELVAMCA